MFPIMHAIETELPTAMPSESLSQEMSKTTPLTELPPPSTPRPNSDPLIPTPRHPRLGRNERTSSTPTGAPLCLGSNHRRGRHRLMVLAHGGGCRGRPPRVCTPM